MSYKEYDELYLSSVGRLSKGCVFSITKEHGRFKFSKLVVNEETGKQWIEAWGGISGHSQFRAIRPEHVRKIEKQ